jgi:hypothetical protein
MATRSGRQRGHIEERGPGRYRVSVYAGVDPPTHRRRYLRETASTQHTCEPLGPRQELQETVTELVQLSEAW